MSHSKAKVVHVKLTMRQADALWNLASQTLAEPMLEKHCHEYNWPVIMAGRKAFQILEDAIFEADRHENLRRAG